MGFLCTMDLNVFCVTFENLRKILKIAKNFQLCALFFDHLGQNFATWAREMIANFLNLSVFFLEMKSRVEHILM